jgi:hypothetical protein
MGLCFFWIIIFTALCAIDLFPPELVRLTVGHDQLEVRGCHRWASNIRHYPVSDVEHTKAPPPGGTRLARH